MAIEIIRLSYRNAGERLAKLKLRSNLIAGRMSGHTSRLFELERRRNELASKFYLRARQLEGGGRDLAVASRQHEAHRALELARAAGASDESLRQLGGQLFAEREPDLRDADLEAEIAETEALIAAETEARGRLAGRGSSDLLARAERWLRFEHGGLPPLLKVQADLALSAASLDELRGLLTELDAEARAVEAAPLPESEARAHLRAAVEAAAGTGSLAAARFAYQTAGSELMPRGLEGPTTWTMLAALLPKEVAEHGERQLRQVYATMPRDAPVPAAERAPRLAAIEARRLSASFYEEVALRAAESEDIAIGPIRRQDAEPCIILADMGAET
jgi:hypothetical protein